MWDIPRLYVSACSNSVQSVPLHPIIISILLQHYKELKECISEVDQIEDQVNSSKKEEERLTIKEEEKGEEEQEQMKEMPSTTLDGYIYYKNMTMRSNKKFNPSKWQTRPAHGQRGEVEGGAADEHYSIYWLLGGGTTWCAIVTSIRERLSILYIKEILTRF